MATSLPPVDSFAGSLIHPKPDAPQGYPWGVPIAEPPPALVAFTDHRRGQSYALVMLEGRLFCLRRDDTGTDRLHAALTPGGWILGNGCGMTAPADWIILAAEWVVCYYRTNRSEALSGCAVSIIRSRYARAGLDADALGLGGGA